MRGLGRKEILPPARPAAGNHTTAAPARQGSGPLSAANSFGRASRGQRAGRPAVESAARGGSRRKHRCRKHRRRNASSTHRKTSGLARGPGGGNEWCRRGGASGARAGRQTREWLKGQAGSWCWWGQRRRLPHRPRSSGVAAARLPPVPPRCGWGPPLGRQTPAPPGGATPSDRDTGRHPQTRRGWVPRRGGGAGRSGAIARAMDDAAIPPGSRDNCGMLGKGEVRGSAEGRRGPSMSGATICRGRSRRPGPAATPVCGGGASSLVSATGGWRWEGDRWGRVVAEHSCKGTPPTAWWHASSGSRSQT